MKKILFLCSGKGGNLKFLQACIDLELVPEAMICGVVSDRACGALEFAVSRGIKAWCADFSAAGQARMCDDLRELGPDYIVTTIHKILFTSLVTSFAGKLINLHYSMLPAFAGAIGMKPVEQAIAYGAKWMGVTVHNVDETLDLGAPLSQAVLPLFDNDTAPLIMDGIFRAGCIALYSCFAPNPALERGDGQDICILRINQRQVCFNPPVALPDAFNEERFWMQLK